MTRSIVSRLFVSAIAVAGLSAVAYRASTCCDSFVPAGAVAIGASIVVSAALLAIAWRARTAFVGRFAAEVALIGLVLVSAEFAVTAAKSKRAADAPSIRLQQRERAAAAFGLPFDRRTPLAVAQELRAQGVDALPGTGRAWPMNDAGESVLVEGFYPLSHASDAVIVECNEDGQYRLHATDEFGLNNPPGLIASGRVDVAVVGESLVWGHCVGPGESMVDRLRERYPNTANLGFAGTRVLTQLASFREYVEPVEPKFVVWAVNPFYALPAEEAFNATLRRYLDPEFSQALMGRQRETDEAIRQRTLLRLAANDETSAEGLLEKARDFRNVYKLSNLRHSLSIFGAASAAPAPEPDLGTFEQALRLADATVRSWGGRLLVVILPSFRNVTDAAAQDLLHSKVSDVVGRLELEVIDGDALFRASDDPAGFFPLRLENHPNADGHALLASAVVGALAGMERSSVRPE